MAEMDLITWYLAQLDEDEAAARAAAVEGSHWYASSGSVWSNDPESDPVFPVIYDEGRPLTEQATHIARHDPAHVLADIAAKRAIVEFVEATMKDAVSIVAVQGTVHIDRQILRLLALPYAIRPGYDPAWAPL